jgi:iron complex outermembrane receptor protein
MKRYENHRRIAAALLASATLAGIASPAAAQQVAARQPAEDRTVADSGEIAAIVVTARRREENLQNVPDTITAFSPAVIEERRLDTIGDFLQLTPNVNITADQDAATNNISIRGLGSNRNQAAAVAFSVDGVILPDADAFTMDLSDVERLEVLKGPQGALYGKGAIAGAINITTPRPTNDFEGKAELGYESGDIFRAFGAVGGPIVTDKVLARLSVLYRNGDGTIKNDLTGKPANPQDQFRIRGRVILQPTEALEVDLRASYYDEKAGSVYFSAFDVLGTTNGEITEDIARRNPAYDGPSSTKRKVTDLSMLVNLETAIGTLTAITAYDDIKIDFHEDIEVSPFPLVPDTNQLRRTKGFSQEVRLTSASDRRLRYIVGGYYQRTTRAIRNVVTLDLCLFAGTCFAPGGDFVSSGVITTTLADYSSRTNQYSLFGQFNYDLTDQLELTAALRYDTIDGRQDDHAAGVVDTATFSRLQPKVSLSYRPTEALTLYGTYSQGFKSGAFNPVSAGPGFPRVVSPEVSKNYELGLRTNLFDRRVRANVAAFYTQHLNPQIFQLDPATFGQGSLNAKEARIKGFEFDIVARPTRLWDVNIAFGYVDAKVHDFNGIDDAYVGQQLPNAPKYTLNIGTGYRIPLKDELSLRLRADYKLTGRESFQDFQLPTNPDLYLYQKSFGLLDGQIGLEGDRWGVTVFGRNLLKRRYATSAFSRYIFSVALVPLATDAIQPDFGRTFGAELRVRF